MTLTPAMTTFDTLEPLPLAAWWAEATEGKIVQENDGFFVVVALPGGTHLAFQKVPDPTPGKNRIHLDLVSPEPEKDVAALLAAGATLVAEREMPGFSWTTLADPAGNQFCVAAAGAH